MRKNKSVYIYPDTLRVTNEYVISFHQSFLDNGYKVNSRLKFLRIFNLLLNLDSDIFIIQWVDMFPQLKLGKLRCIYLIFCVQLLKLLNKKIVWVLHNKTAHDKNPKNIPWINKIMKSMAKYSDLVIVHSQDGILFFKNKFGEKLSNKVVYIPHPAYKKTFFDNAERDGTKWDYIIWGTVNRYKNIDAFLDYANSSQFFQDKKILIVGKSNDDSYTKLIQSKIKKNVLFVNSFIDDTTLQNYILQSENILFTYSTDSVLSSGALIYSLNFGKPIIGPAVGNFKEFEGGATFLYHQFSDIESFKYPLLINESKVTEFVKNNQWRDFPDKIVKTLNHISNG